MGRGGLMCGVSMRHLRSGILVLAVAAVALGGCSSKKEAHLDPFAGKGSPYYSKPGPVPKGGGKYYVGKPYQVAGRWFVPKEDTKYDKVGLASWYGPQFHRRMTSNGEWFDMDYMSAAHPTLPIPSYARVTNLENGKQVIVRINDRGPFVGTRIIDLSRKAATALAFKETGTAKVRVKYLGPAPLGDDTRQLAALNRRLQPGGETIQVASAAKPKPTPPPVQIAAVVAAPVDDMNDSSSKSFFVQVGSFSNESNAERTKEQLAAAGPVQVTPVEGTEGTTLYRVRIGPLSNEQRAQSALAEAQETGHPDAKLIVVASAY